MSDDRKDDDVIVISEEDVSYETPEGDDTVDPAESSARSGAFARGDSLADGDRLAGDRAGDDDELTADDQATDDAHTAAGRFGPATPGDAAADTDDHPVTEPVTPTGSRFGTAAEADAQPGLVTDAADVNDANGTADVNGTGVNGNGSGSAIPMPAAASTAATPATAPVTPVTSSATPDADWPQIQSLFVDDPQAAVKQAADVAGGALAALVAAANNREQTLRDSWQGDSTGTEDLRTALREYRELAGRLSTVSKDL